MTHDPLTTGAGLLQTDLLRDRPGEWWGQAAPDLVISAVSGGAGWAARGLRSARVAQDLGTAGAAGRRLYTAGSPWSDPAARARCLDDLQAIPENRQSISRPASDWGEYQWRATGSPLETRLTSGEIRIWADHVTLDPDTVTAVEVKLTANPGRSPYDGTAPDFMIDSVLNGFDREMTRYRQVIADQDNPVGRLRLIVSDQATSEFLGARARSILGPDIDLDTVIYPKG